MERSIIEALNELVSLILNANTVNALVLLLLSFVSLSIYRERNDNKSEARQNEQISDANKSLTIVITELTKPIQSLTEIQALAANTQMKNIEAIDRLVARIDKSDAAMIATVDKNMSDTVPLLRSIADTLTGLKSASDYSIKFINEQPNVVKTVADKITSINDGLMQVKNEIMSEMRQPKSAIDEIKSILVELRQEISIIRFDIEQQTKTLNDFNSRVVSVENKAIQATQLVNRVVRDKTNEQTQNDDHSNDSDDAIAGNNSSISTGTKPGNNENEHPPAASG